MYGRMGHRKWQTAALPERAKRPWGEYEVIGGGHGYCVKRICIGVGQRLSYQRHAARSEHWYVVSGAGRVTLNAVEQPVGPGASLDVPVGVAHRVANVGDDALVFIEVQTGAYLGEDDIERLSDDYGRVLKSADAAAT